MFEKFERYIIGMGYYRGFIYQEFFWPTKKLNMYDNGVVFSLCHVQVEIGAIRYSACAAEFLRLFIPPTRGADGM